MSVFLTTEELDFIKKGTAEYTKIKIAIGELELQKQSLVRSSDRIAEAFSANEKVLIDKYGADAVINTQTGEVKQKEKQ